MKSSRLSALHVNIIGIVVTLVAVLIMYFAMVKPKKDQTVIEVAAASSAETSGGTTVDNNKTASELKHEQANTVQINKDWMVYSNKYMPNLHWGKDVMEDYYFSNKVNEIPRQWGSWVTTWYDAQHRDGIDRGIGVVFPVPSLASDPNGIANLSSITFPSAKAPWKVTVMCKTFDDAMAHLRRFNGMEHHGMPVIDHVTLSGHSPELALAYDLSLYVIPGEAPPAPDARIGAGGGGGGGGTMGGPMGGMNTGGGMGGGMGGKKGMGGGVN